jgi:molybdopterin molybdotransferase
VQAATETATMLDVETVPLTDFGEHELVPLDAARRLVLGLLGPLPVVDRPVERSRSLRLGADVVAPIPIPTFDNAAMDGYAVDTGSCVTAGGRTTCSRFWPISTGMPIPRGSDAIVPVEAVRAVTARGLETDAVPAAGDHFRRAGEELPVGGLALGAGTVLTPGAIGLLSSLGITSVPVVPRPRVAIVVTGDEVVGPGCPLPEGRIYDADGPLCRALVEEAGGEVVAFELLRDDPATIGSRLERLASEADVVCSTGGASVGTRDHLVAEIRARGRFVVHQLAMKPARPTSMGLIGATPIFVLPGNPLAVLVGFEALARPALRRMLGSPDVLRPRVEAVARCRFPHRPGRLELVPARIVRGEEPGMEPASSRRGSAVLSGAAVADGLALLDAERGDVVPGDRVPLELWT